MKLTEVRELRLSLDLCVGGSTLIRFAGSGIVCSDWSVCRYHKHGDLTVIFVPSQLRKPSRQQRYNFASRIYEFLELMVVRSVGW